MRRSGCCWRSTACFVPWQAGEPSRINRRLLLPDPVAREADRSGFLEKAVLLQAAHLRNALVSALQSQRKGDPFQGG